MIFWLDEFSWNKVYVVIVRDRQVVRDQQKFGNHCVATIYCTFLSRHAQTTELNLFTRVESEVQGGYLFRLHQRNVAFCCYAHYVVFCKF